MLTSHALNQTRTFIHKPQSRFDIIIVTESVVAA